jgi:competence protein ComEA
MANRTRRAGRRRPGSAVRSVAQAEAELTDDVRRRLRATVRDPGGWVPSAPEGVLVSTAREQATREPSGADEAAEESLGEQTLGEERGGEERGGEDGGGEDGGDNVRHEVARLSMSRRLRDSLGDRLPQGLRGAELAPSRAAVAGLAGLLVASLVVALVLTWWHRPHESPVPSVRRSVPASAVATLSPTTSATPALDVVVDVTGAVRRPGLVQLPGGSRVDDALSAAGGATHKADLASVNLARRLVDGEQIVVLRKGQTTTPVGAPGPPAAGSPTPGQPVDLNTATLAQLDGLPGVGPVLAQRILDWRTEHGRFSSVDELTEVSGIGERTLADIRPLVRV